MMKLVRALCASALLVAGTVLACPTVSVAPVMAQATLDHTKTAAEIRALTGGVGLFGATVSLGVSRIEGCQVTLGYTAITVFIARELPKGSCAYRHVLAHEEQHVLIMQEALRSSESRINAALSRAVLPKAVASVVIANRQLHEVLDSTEEYGRNRTACGGAILRLTGLPYA